MPSKGLTFFFRVRPPRTLAGSSDDAIERLLLQEESDSPMFFEALVEATQRRTPDLLTAIQQRIDRALGEDPSQEILQSWVYWAIRGLAEAASPKVAESLYRWGEDPRLTATVALTLADLRDSKAIPLLLTTVESDSMAMETRSRAAAVLQMHFAEPAGLRHFAANLVARERDSFRCGFNTFLQVGTENRDREYLREVTLAVQRQPVADHVVTLMFLLRKAKNPELVVPVLASRLEDRRRARDLLRSPMRGGRIRDFAVYYLASILWPEENFGRPPNWWVRKLRSAALRRRVRAALPKRC